MAPVTDNMRGALLMMASMACFTLNDACLKLVSDQLPLFQAVFLRGILTTLCLWLLARALGHLRRDIPPADRKLIVLRSLSEVVAAYFFITALFNMPLANVTAILQALPLTVTLAGAVFLGEAVGWRRLVAILAGFAGVLMIIQPGGDGFTSYAFFALAAVVTVTFRDLAARRMSRQVPSTLAALVASLAVTLAAGLASVFDTWQPVGGAVVALVPASALFLVGGYTFSVSAMRVGEIGFVTPFRYFGLLVALVAGVLVFGEWPNALTLAGAAIVVASGLFTFYRERRLRRGGGC